MGPGDRSARSFLDVSRERQLGVWYTPVEVVHYMVARVDRALKDDLDIPDGLAAENVHILGPCCGTGAGLVPVVVEAPEQSSEVASGRREAAQPGYLREVIDWFHPVPHVASIARGVRFGSSDAARCAPASAGQ